jgi:hypothetical protein
MRGCEARHPQSRQILYEHSLSIELFGGSEVSISSRMEMHLLVAAQEAEAEASDNALVRGARKRINAA